MSRVDICSTILLAVFGVVKVQLWLCGCFHPPPLRHGYVLKFFWVLPCLFLTPPTSTPPEFQLQHVFCTLGLLTRHRLGRGAENLARAPVC